MKKLIVLSLLSVTVAFAETTTSGSSTTAAPALAASKIFGMFETRPTWTASKGNWGTENTAQLGYQITNDTLFDYIQYFNTDLYKAVGPTTLNLVGDEGFARLRVKNLVNYSSGASIGYEGRLYLPTVADQRSAGLITAMRHYFNYARPITSKTTLLVQAFPVIFGFDKPAASVNGGPYTANSLVDARLYVVPMIQINPKLVVNVPLMVWASLHNHAPGAVKDGATTFTAMIWPEVYYNIGPKTQIGVSYRSGNFANVGLVDGLTQGVFQGIFAQSI